LVEKVAYINIRLEINFMALPQVALPTYELELPSNGKKVKYRPFVVKEEKLLLLALDSKDDKEIERAIKNLLKSCVQSRLKVDDLPVFDLEYLFLNIRAVSVGEDIEMNITCRDDEKTQVKYNFNIAEVGIYRPEGHTNKIKLSDEMGLIMKYPGFDQFVSGSIVGEDVTPDGVVEVIAECIDQIYDGEEVYDSSTTTKKEFIQFVEGLTNKQFEQVQDFFESAPRLEHKFKITNPNTGIENEYVIRGLQNFFG
tara:strand:- start:1078 stop:1839 length:762 start_codon:yes stop_codon:yes gene_type:complete